jgi:DNA-binding winged helix-turn-helix (wHTH) protein
MPLLFGDFVFDPATRQLLRNGRETHLEPKAFELLDLLLARRPEAVAKNEIHERLWPNAFVSESSLTGLMAQLRRALGEDPRRPRFVRTVHRFGYAFCGDVSAPHAPVSRKGARAPEVIWEQRRFPLTPGENVLGRAADAQVCVEVAGVSRRHARIVLAEDQATLEDLASKNGTYLRELRLTRPVVLSDGDAFRLGRQLLVYRSAVGFGSTLTETAGRRRSGRSHRP